MTTSTNLNNTATMTAYYNDLKLFFQKAGAFTGQRVVLHVEPDFWGYMEQRALSDNAATVPAKVSETGIAELQGLPSNVAGLRARGRQAARHLRAERHARLSHQRVGHRRRHRHLESARRHRRRARRRAPPPSTSRSARTSISRSPSSAIAIAAFKQYVYGDGGASWWNADDFGRSTRFLGGFSSSTGKRLVMWQIPLGNTRMRSQNNTWGHYQDNRIEWLLDEPARTHLAAYRNAGVVAFLFGGGAGGVTCACNADNDGVTNPAAINGNTIASELAAAGTPPAQVTRGTVPTLVTPYAADDDGGFFRWKAFAYYQAGALPLGQPAPPANLRRIR